MSRISNEASNVRRSFFAENIDDLISSVLRLNRLDASVALGVDYCWLRKACSIGLTRADSRNISLLTKIAEKFHIKVEDLWTPQLLDQIWNEGHLPDVRKLFVREFKFDQFVASSKRLRENKMSREIPVVSKFVVMELSGREVERYYGMKDNNFNTEQEAEDAITKHLAQMGGLMGPTPRLFVVKLFHGES